MLYNMLYCNHVITLKPHGSLMCFPVKNLWKIWILQLVRVQFLWAYIVIQIILINFSFTFYNLPFELHHLTTVQAASCLTICLNETKVMIVSKLYCNIKYCLWYARSYSWNTSTVSSYEILMVFKTTVFARFAASMDYFEHNLDCL